MRLYCALCALTLLMACAPAGAPREDRVLDVSMIQLLCNPKKFHGKVVRTRGVFSSRRTIVPGEGPALWRSKDAFDYGMIFDAMRIELHSDVGDVMDHPEVVLMDGVDVAVEGVFNADMPYTLCLSSVRPCSIVPSVDEAVSGMVSDRDRAVERMAFGERNDVSIRVPIVRLVCRPDMLVGKRVSVSGVLGLTDNGIMLYGDREAYRFGEKASGIFVLARNGSVDALRRVALDLVGEQAAVEGVVAVEDGLCVLKDASFVGREEQLRIAARAERGDFQPATRRDDRRRIRLKGDGRVDHTPIPATVLRVLAGVDVRQFAGRSVSLTGVLACAKGDHALYLCVASYEYGLKENAISIDWRKNHLNLGESPDAGLWDGKVVAVAGVLCYEKGALSSTRIEGVWLLNEKWPW